MNSTVCPLSSVVTFCIHMQYIIVTIRNGQFSFVASTTVAEIVGIPCFLQTWRNTISDLSAHLDTHCTILRDVGKSFRQRGIHAYLRLIHHKSNKFANRYLARAGKAHKKLSCVAFVYACQVPGNFPLCQVKIQHEDCGYSFS